MCGRPCRKPTSQGPCTLPLCVLLLMALSANGDTSDRHVAAASIPQAWSRPSLIPYAGKVRPVRCGLSEVALQKTLKESQHYHGPVSAFDDDTRVCLNASASTNKVPGAGTASVCAKICKVDCLRPLMQGDVWMACLLPACPGIEMDKYAFPPRDTTVVTAGVVTVPLAQTTTSESAALPPSSSHAEPKQLNIQTTANSSFLVDVKSLLRDLGSSYGPRQFSARLTATQTFGSITCNTKKLARVKFSVQTEHVTHTVYVASGETKVFRFQLMPHTDTLLFATTVDNLSGILADSCVNPVWMRPKITLGPGMPQPSTECKPQCRDELYRSGRAPLTCFIEGCSGERLRLDKRAARHQPYIVFTCRGRATTLGVDTVVARGARRIRFFHDPRPQGAAIAPTPGLGMKGNVELTLDLALIRRQLHSRAPRVVAFDLLSARVGLVPLPRPECLWSSHGRLYTANASHIRASPVAATFTVFADGVSVGSVAVGELLTRDFVALLASSSRHLTLRVAYNDSVSKRCTRPVWSGLELQQTRALHFLPCQAKCAQAIASGISPLSCFTGTCPGRVTRSGFRPFFWMEQAAYGVGVDTTEGAAAFRLGGSGEHMRTGLGAQPPSTLLFDLHALRRRNLTFNTFSSHVGIDVSTLCSFVLGQATFRVYLDEKLVYGRRLLHSQSVAEEFHLPVNGARWLKLATKYPDGQDAKGVCAHAVWGGARLWTLLG